MFYCYFAGFSLSKASFWYVLLLFCWVFIIEGVILVCSIAILLGFHYRRRHFGMFYCYFAGFSLSRASFWYVLLLFCWVFTIKGVILVCSIAILLGFHYQGRHFGMFYCYFAG